MKTYLPQKREFCFAFFSLFPSVYLPFLNCIFSSPRLSFIPLSHIMYWGRQPPAAGSERPKRTPICSFFICRSRSRRKNRRFCGRGVTWTVLYEQFPITFYSTVLFAFWVVLLNYFDEIYHKGSQWGVSILLFFSPPQLRCGNPWVLTSRNITTDERRSQTRRSPLNPNGCAVDRWSSPKWLWIFLGSGNPQSRVEETPPPIQRCVYSFSFCPQRWPSSQLHIWNSGLFCHLMLICHFRCHSWKVTCEILIL